MTADWLVAAACLVASAAVLCWPRRSRPARLLTPSIPAAPSLRARIESLSGPRVMTLVVVLAALTGTLVAGPVAGLVAGGYGAIAVRTVLRSRATRAAAAMRTRSLDALCGLAADLRAGLPATGPAPVAAAASLGESTPTNLATGPATIEDRRMAQLASAAWRLAERTGAPIADLVERIEADARAIDRASAAAAAQAAGARATAWLLAALPVGGIGLGYSIGADPLAVLLHTPVGAACAAGAIALQIAGLAWADRIASVGTTRPEPAPPKQRQAPTAASVPPPSVTGPWTPSVPPAPTTAPGIVPASALPPRPKAASTTPAPTPTTARGAAAVPSQPAVASPPSQVGTAAAGVAAVSSPPAVASPPSQAGTAAVGAAAVSSQAKAAPPARRGAPSGGAPARTEKPRPADAPAPVRAVAPAPTVAPPDPPWTAVGLTTPWPVSATPSRTAGGDASRDAGRRKPYPLPRAAASRKAAVVADQVGRGSNT